MKMRSFTRSLVCASLLALVSTGVNAAEKVTLKLAHNLERSHVVHQSFEELAGNDSNLLIVFYVQIMPDDFVMQLHRF